MRADIQAWLGGPPALTLSPAQKPSSASSSLAHTSCQTADLTSRAWSSSSGCTQQQRLDDEPADNARHSSPRASIPPRRVRQDLLWWDSILAQPVVSRSFANDLDLLDPGLYTDASGSGALLHFPLSLPLSPRLVIMIIAP
ncbi:unnamed protein product, partial [Tilletia controversa]